MTNHSDAAAHEMSHSQDAADGPNLLNTLGEGFTTGALNVMRGVSSGADSARNSANTILGKLSLIGGIGGAAGIGGAEGPDRNGLNVGGKAATEASGNPGTHGKSKIDGGGKPGAKQHGEDLKSNPDRTAKLPDGFKLEQRPVPEVKDEEQLLTLPNGERLIVYGGRVQGVGLQDKDGNFIKRTGDIAYGSPSTWVSSYANGATVRRTEGSSDITVTYADGTTVSIENGRVKTVNNTKTK